jgi:hypothetical protein
MPLCRALKELRISGSSRITLSSLKQALADTPGPVYVFDLQTEPHYYIEGLPLYWYGYNNHSPFAEKLNEPNITYVVRRLLRTGKLIHTAADIQTEKTMVENAGFHYIAAYQARHQLPHIEQVDLFLKAVSKLPSKCWVHFHCSAGKGRTTVAMVMYDILKNKNVPLEAIVDRHHVLGGENLFDTTIWEKSTYTKQMLENRKKFIYNFYAYVHDPKGLEASTWKEWLKARERSNKDSLTL